ncbi:4Fe-4S dicluster domain-containing protein [bacterium]|nr:4Fe-4S dicluster domain-containing protein [bacterium]
MAELYPLSLGLHLRRILTELKNQQQIYDLPVNKFWKPSAGRDLAVNFHGRPAATALGPAAGPQDQLIQNILLSWLGGCRIVELKTVQIMDELKITRPCIYAGNVGYNVEWSQELRLQQSLIEYVASSMLIDILVHEDIIDFGADKERASHTIFDLSVGYDLKGISSPEVRGFIDQTLDASAMIERLKSEIPDDLKHLRDIPFKSKIVNSITLSTFHGCPKEEIENICRYLLCEVGVHTVIKLNPTQLDRPYLEELLHDRMGYQDMTVNPKAWETSLSLDEAVAIVERLEPLAKEKGLNIGVKFSNTLELINKINYFSDEVMYMSGPPLHVIAMTLLEEWRKKVGNRFPITFAAGIDRDNFPDAMALGLTPITACTDLLKTRGYARSVTYLNHLEEKMAAVGAADVEEWVLLSYGHHQEAKAGLQLDPQLAAALQAENPKAALRDFCRANPSLKEQAEASFKEWVSQTSLLNTTDYCARVRDNPRYGLAKNTAAPKKVGSALYLLDCIACGKCVPVCPNDANFSYEVEPVEVEGRNFKIVGAQVLPEESFSLKVKKNEQWAVYADFCNECGNCDTYCPEDGGPFAQKPKFFGTMETFEHHVDRDGFYAERSQDKDRLWGRFRGRQYFLEVERAHDRSIFTDHVLEVTLDRKKPTRPLKTHIVEPGQNGHILEMKYYFWMEKCLEGVLNEKRVNYVNVRFLEGSAST